MNLYRLHEVVSTFLFVDTTRLWEYEYCSWVEGLIWMCCNFQGYWLVT